MRLVWNRETRRERKRESAVCDGVCVTYEYTISIQFASAAASTLSSCQKHNNSTEPITKTERTTKQRESLIYKSHTEYHRCVLQSHAYTSTNRTALCCCCRNRFSSLSLFFPWFFFAWSFFPLLYSFPSFLVHSSLLCPSKKIFLFLFRLCFKIFIVVICLMFRSVEENLESNKSRQW